MEDLIELVSALVELATTKPRQELCKIELAEIGGNHQPAVLDDVLDDHVSDEKIEIDNMLHGYVRYL